MILKFLFDRLIAFIGLLFLWPLILITAVLVKIKMPDGPVFFVQKRVGKDGKLFNCHKFRTMSVVHNGSSVSVAGDTRITPLGATLRHYKIDELPELWDVLRGEMSFVGPRPDVPGYADKLTGSDRALLKIRPGITGPATLKYRLEDEMIAAFVQQIKKENKELLKSIIDAPDFSNMSDQKIAEWYNDNVIYPDKVRLNCYYYHNYNFIQDVKMIFATIFRWKILYAGEII